MNDQIKLYCKDRNLCKNLKNNFHLISNNNNKNNSYKYCNIDKN